MADAHSRTSRRRACDRCRISKSQCDRRSSGCTRCVAAGKVCVYAVPDSALRVRNETAKAERHAVSAWRARATNATSQRTSSPRIAYRIQQPVSTDVRELARYRFIYDFSESKSGLSAMSFGDLSGKTMSEDTAHLYRDGLNAALTATSLANFHVRHYDTRAVSAASSALSKALGILGNSLRSSSQEVTLDLVLAAVLLGLHQNISHEEHLIGSWVHHFRGSVNLLEAASTCGLDNSTYLKLSQLMEKQALCISLIVGLPFCLPVRMRQNFTVKTDLRSRTWSLAASTADFCAHMLKERMKPRARRQTELRKQFELLDTAFGSLESELRICTPYHTQESRSELYPQWYHIISTCAGGPQNTHSYAAMQDAAVWNFERMARMKLQSLALDLNLCGSSIVAKLSGLIEDLCASIYYILSYQPDGAKPLTSFDDVAGSKAYSLISPIAIAIQCVESKPWLGNASDRLLWLKNVLAVFKDRLGISDAWCWNDGDEVDARLRIERELSFDT